jgi:hypothetical protein
MGGPTREQVREWAKETEFHIRNGHVYPPHVGSLDVVLKRLCAIAYAAGAREENAEAEGICNRFHERGMNAAECAGAIAARRPA